MGEELEVDVLFVGGGPASLAGAYHLMQMLKIHNEHHETDHAPTVAIIEKSAYVGAHGFSGAVMDPKGMHELMPNFLDQGFPIEAKVEHEEVLFLTKKSSFKLPLIPPMLRNHGNYIISLNKVVQWLAKKVEEEGVSIFSGFSGAELLFDGEKVIGVRTGEKGIDKNGKKKANYEAGMDIKAKIVVLGEGPRGSLTKQLVEKFSLKGKNPQTYATGVKELWEVPVGRMKKGSVIHTMGYPLENNEFGGSFVYALDDTHLYVGFVTGLDTQNPYIDPHHELQRFKLHPKIRALLEDGKMTGYGAKTIPEGGWHSMPQLYTAGCLLIGDSASMLNSMRLKGIHLAIKSGMLAAETIVQALHDKDYSEKKLSLFYDKIKSSWIHDELWPVRNMHQGFEKGMFHGMFNVGIQMLTHGMGFQDPLRIKADHEHRKKLDQLTEAQKNRYADLVFDGKLTFDKVTNVFASQTKHDVDQPVHLHVADTNICSTTCFKEFGNPCQRFCPANVYEMIDVSSGKPKLVLHAENCVHCKTCDIADPYQIITWVPPEGGGGPNYSGL